MLVLDMQAFGNSPCGEIPTKKEPIRTLGFAFPYNKMIWITT